MTTQFAFRIDEDLKKRALLKAKKEGVSLKVVYMYMTQAWLEWRIKLGFIPTVPITHDDVYTAEDHEARVQGRKDLENGDAVDFSEIIEKYA